MRAATGDLYGTLSGASVTALEGTPRGDHLPPARALPRAASPQFHANLERPASLEYGHMDAECGPKLADLQAHRQRSALPRLARPELRHPDDYSATIRRHGRRSCRSYQVVICYTDQLAAVGGAAGAPDLGRCAATLAYSADNICRRVVAGFR